MQLQRHYITRHYTTLIALHFATTATATTTTTTLCYIAVHYTNYTATQLQLHYFTPHYAIPHYSTQHCSTLHCTNHTTPQLQLQLQLHYTTATATTAPRNTTSSSCGEVTFEPLQPLQETQLQPPFGPSVDSLCHPRFTTTSVSYRFPIFETSATALRGTTGIMM